MVIDVDVLNRLVNCYCAYDNNVDFRRNGLPNTPCVSFELVSHDLSRVIYEVVIYDEDDDVFYKTQYYESLLDDDDWGYGSSVYEYKNGGSIFMKRVYPEIVQTINYSETK